MSANVWFEEVNNGLVNDIYDTVRQVDVRGNLVPLDKGKQIVVRKPEEDLKFEKYPCISIYNRSESFDPLRYDPNQVVVSRDYKNHQIMVEDPHISFTLSYQIDFWARYQTDMDTITRTWKEKHFRQFNLSVVDDGGNERTVNCMVKGDTVRADLVDGKERLFHSIVNLEIWVELDSETRYNEPMVDDLSINVTAE